ncbi:MAG: MBL fold metallo-hydrolase [Actinobacteria bacterium]|nr:MBL fold metallo-hydrolase [Actinomycetota bacterium]
MLRQVAEGVLVHQSEFMQTNAVVVQGENGALLVDAGVLEDELSCLADDLRMLSQPVVAAFSTHPHWDHLLWHARLGEPPRYATDRCAATVRQKLPDAAARSRVTAMMPPDIVGKVPLDLLGEVTGLPAGTTQIPWDGPTVRIVEHRAHADGHAALLIDDARVLIAGDMLSDILIPMLDLSSADPIADYLDALDLLDSAAGTAEVVIPGHGSVGDAAQLAVRIAQDRAYLEALRTGNTPDDPRLKPTAYGRHFLPAVHDRQRQHLAQRSEKPDR